MGRPPLLSRPTSRKLDGKWNSLDITTGRTESRYSQGEGLSTSPLCWTLPSLSALENVLLSPSESSLVTFESSFSNNQCLVLDTYSVSATVVPLYSIKYVIKNHCKKTKLDIYA